MLSCVVCGKELVGKQKRFCSLACKNQDGNNKYQNYVAQQQRGLLRKLYLIGVMGGCCSTCGYNKNLAALCFHHTTNKEFRLDSRRLSNGRLSDILVEATSCVLLCANCHAEIHHPHLTSVDMLPPLLSEIERTPLTEKPRCVDCGCVISSRAVRCNGCQHKKLEWIEWPSTAALQQMLADSSFVAVGKKLGVSDNAVRHRLKCH